MYEVLLQSSAERFLKKLDKENQKRIIAKLRELKENPKLGVPLTAGLAGLWKLRMGDFRVIYQIKNKELAVLVLKLGHRKNIYESNS